MAVRNIRRDAIQDLRDLEKEHLISEDELKRGQADVQEQTDHYHQDRSTQIIKEKDAEIMRVGGVPPDVACHDALRRRSGHFVSNRTVNTGPIASRPCPIT